MKNIAMRKLMNKPNIRLKPQTINKSNLKKYISKRLIYFIKKKMGKSEFSNISNNKQFKNYTSVNKERINN